MRTLIVNCRSLLLLVLITPVSSAIAETIELVHQGGDYLVPVQINRAILLPFVLDTGATNVVIPADVFLTLRRTGTVKNSGYVGTGTAILADGSEHPREQYLLRELRVGDHVVRNVVASVSPVKGEPLLGQSFLSKLPSWTIDNERHALIFHDKGSPTGNQQEAAIGIPTPAPRAELLTEIMSKGDAAVTRNDYAEALRWYRKAAEQGDPITLAQLTTMVAEWLITVNRL
jgi:gag-polyprotein putative aspartyl protease